LTLHFKERVLRAWPLSHHPELVSRGVGFFARWGVIAVFCGRFFGPLRAIVPVAAGLSAMPWWQFQIANLASAILWATGILGPGFVGVRFFLG
jgi:membrane protein DedA with SNARE-associated domain